MSSANHSKARRLVGLDVPENKIRNIGIMAHIDAGKTTTTERMLYYSGFTNHLGDVDDGDTITDYMEQERERGITITSAAVTFPWKGYHVNLIDTPGHVDFTLEVERCLRILDGAIAVIDGSAGVEAQTVTVWHQADRYKIPRIIYINKMDKTQADFNLSIESIKSKLSVLPLILQNPIGNGRSFRGVVDLLNMKKLLWSNSVDGKTYKIDNLQPTDDLYTESLTMRNFLIEQLADLDDHIANLILMDTKYEDISANDLTKAIRKVTINSKAVPILCGSSFKNKGVQPLLDSVVHYLPNPSQIDHPFTKFYQNSLCGLAFKIINDKQRGPLTFVRIFSGKIENGQSVFNINKECSEKVTKLLQISADSVTDLSHASSGHIVAISGLKETITGDTLVKNLTTVTRAKKSLDKDEETVDEILASMNVPEPVFFCSIEPPSQAYMKQLDYALACLTKEDPSLRVTTDNETGQTILSGMGELHLEIIKDRILKEYGVDADLGDLQVSYRESIKQSIEEEFILDQTIGNKKHQATIHLSIHSLLDGHNTSGMKFKGFIPKPTKEAELYKLKRPEINAINNGIRSALSKGTILGFPVIDVEVHLHNVSKSYSTSLPMLTTVTAMCVERALRKGESILLEPTMLLDINSNSTYSDRVLSDLGQRRSQILNVDARDDLRMIRAITPLSELLGYSTAIRTMTSGTTSFTMHMHDYQVMSEMDKQTAVSKLKY
ncbi:DgyrCDS696 [Dimorphilus gyrociliatus]|uniref:DgyrCDS696 n=1 Tax=Dimorphilus gyrociliatus TaxID=2664684 RepID=A0A7I8V868_9ANNE|nr:DgyrCDS696 [Dimorphilus gyrociliatus]